MKQYYIYTKDALPMDIEFIVQDVFALTRPQWKLASNLEEATRVFQLAMAQDQKTAGLDKAAEPEEADSDQSSDDGMGDGDGDLEAADHDGDEDDGSATGDESDVSYRAHLCFHLLTTVRLTPLVIPSDLLMTPIPRKNQS